jgi:hypothetical protein
VVESALKRTHVKGAHRWIFVVDVHPFSALIPIRGAMPRGPSCSREVRAAMSSDRLAGAVVGSAKVSLKPVMDVGRGNGRMANGNSELVKIAYDIPGGI